MPSIFEKPSILGFRADGGPTPPKKKGIIPALPGFIVDNLGKVSDVATGYGANLLNRFWGTEFDGTNFSETPFTPGGGLVDQILGYGQTGEVPFFGAPPEGSGRGASGSWGDAVAPAVPTYNGPMAAAPTGRQTPLPGLGGGAVPTATSGFMDQLLKLPTSADVPSVFGTMLANAQQQQPTGSRAANIAAAKASGDFETKRNQYNLEAQRMGSPTQMNEAGDIIPRELSEPEKMREFFNMTGGNTMFTQTNDPAQRALQNEMMKQARGQMAANTFGSTPEERRANLEAEVNARKILASPLDSGVREMAPGIRGAFKDGRLIGVAAPGDGSPATMNDPLKRYITNPDGSVSLNPNPPQILMSDEMKDTLGRQGIEGKTGGSPMERRLIAAMAAEEARKKKLADDAAAAALAAAPPTTEAELIARTPSITIAPREAAAPKPPPPTSLTPLKDIKGSSYVDPKTKQKMIW